MDKTWSKRLGRLAASALCAAVLASPLTTFRAMAITSATAVMRPDMTILIDGEKQSFYDESAKQVHPLLYKGSTYLPVRAIGELMGRNVDWDGATKTVTLSGRRTSPPATGVSDGAKNRQNVNVTIRDDFTVIVDGAVRSFADVNGTRVYPLLCKGSTYLPVRAIGELMEKKVGWDQTAQTVSLDEKAAADMDTFGLITLEQAKSKALEHAGLNASQVSFTKQKLDWDNGQRVYDIEFYTTDYLEYDYEIDAVTGSVLSFGHESGSVVPPDVSNLISLEEAKSKALAHAGLTARQVTFAKQVLGREDGRPVYEIEFFTNDQTNWYEYEIDAASGRVISYEVDAFATSPFGRMISLEDAKSKALAHAGLTAGQVTFTKTELSQDDGRLVYEIEFRTDNYLGYEYEIDAMSGEIWSFDQDHTSLLPPIPSGVISLDEAKAIALAHAGLSSEQVNFTKQKLDRDDGRQIYEIKFFTRDLVEYDYEIDGLTGKILSFDKGGAGPTDPSTKVISEEQARNIALKQVPGATAQHIKKLELEFDDGKYIYEIEIEYGRLEYDIEIDGVTGAILEFKVDD